MLYCDPVSSDRASSSLWLASATRSAVAYASKTRRAAAGVSPVTEVVAAAVVPQPARHSSSPRAARGPSTAVSTRGIRPETAARARGALR